MNTMYIQNNKRNFPVVESQEKQQEKSAFEQPYSDRCVKDFTAHTQQERQ